MPLVCCHIQLTIAKALPPIKIRFHLNTPNAQCQTHCCFDACSPLHTTSLKIANQITSAVANNVGKAVVLQWKTDICRPQPRSMRCLHAMNMIGHTYFAASLATHTRTKQILTLWHLGHRCFLANQTRASVAASHIIISTKTIIIWIVVLGVSEQKWWLDIKHFMALYHGHWNQWSKTSSSYWNM